MRIGIGITTRNRPDVFAKTYAKMLQFAPNNAKLVVIDDASDIPVLVPGTFRFEQNVGIPRAKNKCLELLQDCDHIFLFDDDTYPIAAEWWKPYVEHKEPHLMYQFKLLGKPSVDMREVYRDEHTVAYTHTRGAMIYLARHVLDVVGGFDVRYGKGGFEHPDLTNRIHNAGLTTYRAMDVPNNKELLYCMDQDGAVVSSLPLFHKGNSKLYRQQINSKEYKEFR